MKVLSILKPGATKRNITGAINKIIEEANFKIIAQKRIRMTKEQAESFYAIHKNKPFFKDLVSFMTSGPIVVQVLEKSGDAVGDYRTLMGATDPEKADPGTIRRIYGLSIDDNVVHGSDSQENAENEIEFFFEKNEIIE